MAVELELPVPLEGLLKTSQVQVIETVDAGNLKTLLKWIVDKLGQSGSAPAERLDERLAAIENDNEALKQQLGKLQEAQVKALQDPGFWHKTSSATIIRTFAFDPSAVEAAGPSCIGLHAWHTCPFELPCNMCTQAHLLKAADAQPGGDALVCSGATELLLVPWHSTHVPCHCVCIMQWSMVARVQGIAPALR